jgi:hypothetical protein
MEGRKAMTKIFRHRLSLRLLALTVLIVCLVIISRKNSDAHLAATTPQQRAQLAETPRPIVTVQPQMGTPLVISAPRIVSGNQEYKEVAFDLINVSDKPIRAYAIKQEVAVAGTPPSGTALFINLDLTNSPRLPVNQLTTTFNTFDLIPSKEAHVSLSIEYVEFSDGTSWGPDSAKYADQSAGQRAAMLILSKRLRSFLSAGNPDEVMSAIETAAASIEPPAGRSDEWKGAFRSAGNSIVSRLKRAQAKGGLNLVDRELRRLSESSSGRR